MNISQDQIERFFSNQCNAAEAAEVAAYLMLHPEVAETYLDLEHPITTGGKEKLHPIISSKMLEEIRRSTYAKKPRHLWRPYALAAAVLTVVAATALFWTTFQNSPTAGSVTSAATSLQNNLPAVKKVYNQTSAALPLVLPDGSHVLLQPGSCIAYHPSFSGTERLVHLSGTAFFNVAQQRAQPFTVATGIFRTTALGTSFTILEQKHSNRLTVRLFTGKVVVKRTATATGLFVEQLLKPGQQLVINTQTCTALVNALPQQMTSHPSSSLTRTDTAGALVFQQTPLPKVIRILEKHFHVPINCSNNTKLTKMSFTGRFGNREDLASILQNIAILNGLTVTKQDTGYHLN